MEQNNLLIFPRFLCIFPTLVLSFHFLSPISAYQKSSQTTKYDNKEFAFDAKEDEIPGRPQRAVVELNSLLNRKTKYTAAIFSVGKYGNWCGTQDGSTNNGSVKDGCDKCCKVHKLCYKKAKEIVVVDFLNSKIECIPFAKTYSITNDLMHPDCIPIETIDKECSLAACKCDLALVGCLKEEPCPTF